MRASLRDPHDSLRPTPLSQSQLEFWEQDWRSIGRAHYVERLADVRTQFQLYEVVKVRYLDRLFSSRPNLNSMLECGCGTGGVSLYFARRGWRCTMIDLAPAALELAGANFADHDASASFARADVEALPFESNTFDVVTSFGLLEHFVDPAPAIREMVRVLRPGGLFFADLVPRRFCVQTVANYAFNLWVVLLHTVLSRRWAAGWAKVKFVLGRPEYYENSYTANQYEEMMRTAGLGNVTVRGNNPFPRLYLPSILDRLFIGLLVRLLPAWERFDSSRGWLSDIFWPRAWWADARKPVSTIVGDQLHWH